MRILQKTPYVDSEGIRVNFGDIVYRRRGKEAIPSFSYHPDELYCLILKLEGNKVILGGLNPFMQDREHLRRLCYLLKKGFPEKEYPIYFIKCFIDIPWEKLINLKDSSDSRYTLHILQHIDVVVERTGEKRIIDVQESLKQNEAVLYDKRK